MYGHDDDHFLRLNAENCPNFGKALDDNVDYLENLTHSYEKYFFPRLAHLIGQQNITRH